uniref:Hemicentin-1 n=1 Tax=Heterorhabditis bacteriophora TaxID=37862 RepID=A0A1I7X454_HETBA
MDDGQMIEITEAKREHVGRWICTAENDAGARELEISLDVWVPPTVRVNSEAPIKALGETVTLFCETTGNPLPSLSWNKGGQPIISSVEGGTRLDIPHMDKSDVGDYTCQAQNEAGSAEASIHVDVLVPPIIMRDNVDMSPRLPTGQTLTLLCDAGGKPQPQIKWYVNDTEIMDSTEGIALGNGRKYIQYMLLHIMPHKYLLIYDILEAPVISNGGTQQVIEGELARIECLAEGHPTPVVSWLRNGIRVETGVQGVRYIAEGKILTIIEARSSDSGIYVCAATNEAGTAQQAYTLEVLVSPKIVTTSPTESSVPMSSPFSLKCGVRGYPEPKISWALNGKPLVSGKDGNTIGILSDYNFFVDFSQIYYLCAPIVSKDGIRAVNSSEGEPATLSCDIEGDEPQIKWYKNGVLLLPSTNIEFSEDNSVVNIISTRLSDEGEYSCIAMNPAGNATLNTQLYVGGMALTVLICIYVYIYKYIYVIYTYTELIEYLLTEDYFYSVYVQIDQLLYYMIIFA